MTEQELVEAARRGDADAFAVLARQYADRAYAIANRILLDSGAAEDAAQQALLRAWRDLPSLREPARFGAWLRRLVVRACYDKAADDRRWHANIRLIPRWADAPDAPDAIALIAARDEVDRAFARLKAPQRAVLVLRYYLDLPLAEIAATLDLSTGTVSSRLHYALAELRAILEADARSVPREGRTA